jgi:alkylation response protein AidB-like acyl-CoA dehydrogenase
MPFPIQAAVATMLGGADLGFAMVSASARAAAAVLDAHADADLRQTCVSRLASGEWTATIVITEAHAGSDVGLIRTRASKLDGGKFTINGTKIFISGGDHDLTAQILHVVLARIEGDPAGVKGLSLFLVPAVRMDRNGNLGERNGVVVTRIEEKTGLHSSATCVVSFENAQAFPIGRPGEGLSRLFTMMNELRIEVALSATGLSSGATSHAQAYAAERMQGRGSDGRGPVPIIAHPDVGRMLLIMRSLTEGGRALTLEAARLMQLERSAAEPVERRAAADMAGWLLPICKAHISDNALEVASYGIQIRGGHGYVRESGAEQFFRDARVLPIYEGANGIHAGAIATRGLQKDGGATCRAFLAAIRADADNALAVRSLIGDDIIDACDLFDKVSNKMLAAGSDPAGTPAVLYASTDYITFAGRLAIGWMWLRMASASLPDNDPVLGGKRALARFYIQRYGPEMTMLGHRICVMLESISADAALSAAIQPA